jgi:hypothetical protein
MPEVIPGSFAAIVYQKKSEYSPDEIGHLQGADSSGV